MRARHVAHSYCAKKMCASLFKCRGAFFEKFYLKIRGFFVVKML